MADALRRWYRAHVTARPSTLILSAVFVAVVLLYFAVRPASSPAGGSQQTGVTPSHSATPTAPATGSTSPPRTSLAPTTTPPATATTTPSSPSAPVTSPSGTPTGTHSRTPTPSPTVSTTR